MYLDNNVSTVTGQAGLAWVGNCLSRRGGGQIQFTSGCALDLILKVGLIFIVFLILYLVFLKVLSKK